MKITFVYTDYNPFGHNQNKFNLGIAILSACLKTVGHQTELIHISEKINKEQFKRRIQKSNPSLVAFSFISNMWPQVREFTQWISEFNIPTIHGGLHPTISPDEVISFKGVEILCRGEGEGAIVDLCNNMQEGKNIDGISNLWIKREDGKIIRNPIRPLIENLDELPFLDYDIFNYPQLEDAIIMKRLVVMASRGCHYQCTYCCNHLLKGLYPNKIDYVRFKSVDRLIQEIKQGLKEYPFLDTVRFVDDTLSFNKEWFLEFVNRYSEEINLPYTCNDRPNQIDTQIAEGFKRSHCTRVELGIESGDRYIRNNIMKRNLSDEQIKTAFTSLRGAGIKTTAFNILGVPSETMHTLLQTVKLNALVNPDNFTNAYFYPFNGTILFDICNKEGYPLKKNISSLFEKPALELNTVSEQQIIFVYKYFCILTRLYARCMSLSDSLSIKLIAKMDKLLYSRYFPYRLFNRIYGVFDYFKRIIIFILRSFYRSASFYIW